jgi:hypothetical protein
MATLEGRRMKDIETMFIYALTDDAGNVRYVGRTNDLSRRELEHRGKNERNSYLKRWIAKLAREGRLPVTILLEECAESECRAREKFWELYYRERGARLTNIHPCGDGPLRSELGEEWRERLRRALSEANNRPEVRAEKSRRMKELWQDPAWREKALRARAEKNPTFGKGRKRSAETREKIRQAALAREHPRHSPETRKRIRESNKAAMRAKYPLVIGGVTKTLCDWAREAGISSGSLRDRLEHGWDPMEAVTMPKLSGRRCKDKGRLGKAWRFVDPNGREVEIRNLSQYCREHKLCFSSMKRVLQGIYRQHHGWTRCKEEENGSGALRD